MSQRLNRLWISNKFPITGCVKKETDNHITLRSRPGLRSSLTLGS